ncbi:hypothetical protein MOC98_17050 [Bacillus spizizenii]|uniref:Uncharacterized protein n=1 Tax=Bacillus spizizenii TaxID=96241 RepID=A0A9Q4E2I1_BACSC|nr:hypothetical protein [Bacillus spizizenii]MBK4203354.1 hypothetical protein [Bacillus subtilis]MCI4167838.1 hypothetical protein [Bacillus spizizenii]MCY7867268.1 hypothetical protein [Bacillus spizizenii]MCY8454550.1 hypothetical protein [Bacillus spizizenii]MCY8456352.1 hypothetical protein [Bacillus spizizenii]
MKLALLLKNKQFRNLTGAPRWCIVEPSFNNESTLNGDKIFFSTRVLQY